MEDQWSSIINNNKEEEEFQEFEVWDVMKNDEKENRDNFDISLKQRKSFSSVSYSSFAKRSTFISSPQMVIRRAISLGNEGKNYSLKQSSAPVRISHLSHKQNKENGEKNKDFVEDDGENEEEEMIPPHEYVAKRLTSRRVASYSMCEGIGRTLKGRDLCKVRDAILTQTGFIEK